jgi:hypothetical protein
MVELLSIIDCILGFRGLDLFFLQSINVHGVLILKPTNVVELFSITGCDVRFKELTYLTFPSIKVGAFILKPLSVVEFFFVTDCNLKFREFDLFGFSICKC